MDPQLEPFVRRKPADLRLLHAHDTDAALTCLAVGADADGQPLIAVGQADEAVILLLDASLAQVGSLSGHGGGTNSLAFGSSGSSSGSSLVSAGEDGTAAVWDVQQQQLCGRLACDGNNLDK
jgi:WD40 repeat protein